MKKDFKTVTAAILAAMLCAFMTGCAGNERNAKHSNSNIVNTGSEGGDRVSDSAPDPVSEPVSSRSGETDPSSFSYEETDGGIAITYYNGKDENVVIPASIDGKPVVKIGNGEEKVITSSVTESVTVPGSVKTIGKEAFSKCHYLKSVVMEEGVTDIEENAFSQCGDLEDIIIPESVTDIESYLVFSGTKWFEKKKAESTMFIAGGKVIYGRMCTGSVEIPEGITEIKSGAFQECKEITGIKLPGSLKIIGSKAFMSCTGLKEIVLPNSLESIGSSAFSSCRGLTDISFSEKIEEISDSAFSSCKALTSIVLPKNLKKIGEEAFRYCDTLSEITFPDSPIDIGWQAFENTAWLDSKRKEDPLVIAGCCLVDGYSCKGDVVIPDSVKSIAAGAFGINGRYYNDYPYVKSVTLPAGLKVIPEKMFYGNSSLTSIVIPGGVEEIGKGAFHAVSVKKFDLPDSLKKIYANSFPNCEFTYKGATYTKTEDLCAAVNGTGAENT